MLRRIHIDQGEELGVGGRCGIQLTHRSRESPVFRAAETNPPDAQTVLQPSVLLSVSGKGSPETLSVLNFGGTADKA